MGHQRLGKLPARRNLPAIVKYLIDGGKDSKFLVDEITKYASNALKLAVKDPVFVEALWLLIRLPQAAAEENPIQSLSKLGFDFSAITSSSDVVGQYDDALELRQRTTFDGATDLGEMGRLAGKSALYEALESALPSLWAPKAADVATSLATLSRPDRFADMTQNYFARFTSKAIRFFVDRNLQNMIGPDRLAASVNGIQAFNQSIDRHCKESALIMRGFAKDWLANNRYQLINMISQKDVRGFSAFVAQKMEKEMSLRKGAE
jgi:hypothetical protein